MGRAPCCDKANVKKGPWSPEEDTKLKDFIEKYGTGGNWIAFPQKAGLKRCGKSCRLRWLNYLRPNIKHGEFSDEEDRIIYSLYATLGTRWSIIAAQLPGRTDNDIKNYWNTKLKKKLMGVINVISPTTLTQPPPIFSASFQTPTPPCPSLSSFYKDYNSLATNCSGLLQNQENFLMFGGTDQASCFSCDRKGQIKNEEMGFDLQSHISNGCQENQRFMLDYGNNGGNDNLISAWTDDQNPNGHIGNNTFEYGFKQLIRNTDSSSSSNGEYKTQEKAVYFYY